MIKPVPAISDVWIYTYLLQPLLEGVERLNRVWSGREEFHTFESKSLTLEHRAIYLLSGLSLVIPLVGTIVWMVMQTFGQPDHLSDSYYIARNFETVFT